MIQLALEGECPVPLLAQFEGKDFSVAGRIDGAGVGNKNTALNGKRNRLAVRCEAGQVCVVQRKAECDVVVGTTIDLIGYRTFGHHGVRPDVAEFLIAKRQRLLLDHAHGRHPAGFAWCIVGDVDREAAVERDRIAISIGRDDDRGEIDRQVL